MNRLFFLGCALAVTAAAGQTASPSSTSKNSAREPSAPRPSVRSERATPPPPPTFWAGDGSVAGYLKNEPGQVFAWIEDRLKAIPSKLDEFSNSEERRQHSEAVAENMKSVGSIPIVLSRCVVGYNASRESFDASLFSGRLRPFEIPVLGDSTLKYRSATISRAQVSGDTYVGQNAYGAKVSVTREVLEDHALVYPTGPLFEPSSAVAPSSRSIWSIGTGLYRLSFPMSSQVARQKSKQIVCVGVFSIEPPYIARYTKRDAPTVDEPKDITWNVKALVGRLDLLVLMDAVTGEILAKASREGL